MVDKESDIRNNSLAGTKTVHEERKDERESIQRNAEWPEHVETDRRSMIITEQMHKDPW